MDSIRRLLVQFLGLIVATGTTILVMIYGWGLTPQSWKWIIGFSFLGHMTGAIFVTIGQHKEK
jgi:multisubunit Na+/H+ antiporter MnhC subunit